MSITEIINTIREGQIQDTVRLLMRHGCVVAVYARRVLRVELHGHIELLAPWEPAASLSRKLHALFGLTAPAEPCAGCPERGGFPS